MELAEFEEKLQELESKLERLRALYDQYFMGIERMEPSILRREVDRDLWTLRRENIRNTGARYRMQMLSQRYQTMQQYWGRTVRDIENGTYKRDLRKALERFGEAAATSYAARKWKERVERGLAKKEERDTKLASTRREAGLDVPAGAAPQATDASPPAGAPGTPEAAGPAKPLTAPGPACPPGLGLPGAASGLNRGASAFAAQAAAYRQAMSGPTSGKVAAAAPVSGDSPSAAPPSVPQQPSSASLPRIAAAPPSSSLPRIPVVPPSSVSTPASRPDPIVGSVARQPAAPSAASPAVAPDGAVSEARVKQIYAQYVDARRQHNESTASVSYESLAKSIRESATKLREKAGTRAIDFEVAVKDGKTVLKPVVR